MSIITTIAKVNTANVKTYTNGFMFDYDAKNYGITGYQGYYHDSTRRRSFTE